MLKTIQKSKFVLPCGTESNYIWSFCNCSEREAHWNFSQFHYILIGYYKLYICLSVCLHSSDKTKVG